MIEKVLSSTGGVESGDMRNDTNLQASKAIENIRVENKQDKKDKA